MNRSIFVLLFALSSLSHPQHIAAQELTISKEAERDSVERTIHRNIGWAKTKDTRLLYSTVANDTNYLEVDPDSGLIVGIEQFRKNEAFWLSPDFKAIRYEIRDLRIHISQSGTVAWFYCLLDDINEWRGRPANWINTRWTGVLEKRNGKWVMVQMHFSFPYKK